jgi:hypothetical protein
VQHLGEYPEINSCQTCQVLASFQHDAVQQSETWQVNIEK